MNSTFEGGSGSTFLPGGTDRTGVFTSG